MHIYTPHFFLTSLGACQRLQMRPILIPYEIGVSLDRTPCDNKPDFLGYSDGPLVTYIQDEWSMSQSHCSYGGHLTTLGAT